MTTVIEFKEAVSFLGQNRKLVKLTEREKLEFKNDFVLIMNTNNQSITYIPICNVLGIRFSN